MYVELIPALRFQAGADEVNSVTVTRAGDELAIRDGTSPLTAGQGCIQVDGQTASCPTSQLLAAGIDLGDGDDALSVRGSLGGRPWGLGGETRIDGGPGDDRIASGEGPETVVGGPGADEIRGGGGDDLLVADETPRAADIFAGGSGEDTISYRESKVPVRVDLADRSASQGETGDRDTVSGVEVVVGGVAADSLRGDAARNGLVGGEGSDRLAGRGGGDALDGGQGRDALFGGPGADALDVQDGEADDVACGSGLDRVGVVIETASDDPLDLSTPAWTPRTSSLWTASGFSSSPSTTTCSSRRLPRAAFGRMRSRSRTPAGADAVAARCDFSSARRREWPVAGLSTSDLPVWSCS